MDGSGWKAGWMDDKKGRNEYRKVVCLFDLLLYVKGKQFRSCIGTV